jgi:hypothetical protein
MFLLEKPPLLYPLEAVGGVGGLVKWDVFKKGGSDYVMIEDESSNCLLQQHRNCAFPEPDAPDIWIKSLSDG